MPEITSRDLVQKKLQEFDERLEGAFAATEIMVRLKEDASKLVESMEGGFDEIFEMHSALEEIQIEWTALKADISKTHEETRDKLAEVAELTGSRLDRIENDWKAKVDRFMDEVRNELAGHQQEIDRQLSEFLTKQNLLIQNLAQQIDGFQRATQALASDQQKMIQKIGTIEESLKNIPAQDLKIGTMQQEIQGLSAKLEKITTRLQGRFIIGSSFKDL